MKSATRNQLVRIKSWILGTTSRRSTPLIQIPPRDPGDTRLRVIVPARFGAGESYRGAGNYVVEGWINAIVALGWEVLEWDGLHAQGVFDQFDPDLLITDVRFRHNVPTQIRHGRTLVAMVVDQWADEPAYPELADRGYWTTQEHVSWVRKVDPKILFHHTSTKGIEAGWSAWWKREHRRVLSVPLAGDPIEYFDDGDDKELSAELGFLGQYSSYKAPGLHEYLLDLSKHFKTLIFGPGWPRGTARFPFLPDRLRNRFFKSSIVQPCIHEPHARAYGVEVTERLFKVPLAGGLTISDPVNCIHGEGYFEKDELIVASSGEEMRRLVDHFVKHPGERDQLISAARHRILTSHTYFHRLRAVLEAVELRTACPIVDAHIDVGIRTGRWSRTAVTRQS